MQNKEWPLVTVFTLVYNTGKYVVEALESVKENNYPNLEHIIIDDFSTDNQSVEIVERWIDENNYACTFVKHKENKGICKSLNEILNLMKGKYAFGVSDDLITPTRIHEHVKIFEEAEENVAIVFSDVSLIDRYGKITNPSIFKDIKLAFGTVPNGNIYYQLLNNNFIPGVGVTMKVSCVREVGNFDESLYFEDWDLWLRLSRKFTFVRDEKIGGYYRRYSESVWSKPSIKNYECCLQTLDKNITNAQSKKAAAISYHSYAEYYYKAGGKHAYHYFAKALLLKWSNKTSIFLITSFFRVPYSWLASTYFFQSNRDTKA